jgi:hypothetical protein
MRRTVVTNACSFEQQTDAKKNEEKFTTKPTRFGMGPLSGLECSTRERKEEM